MSRRKILIVSHNPISKVDNMGKTIGNIFSNFPKEELCQLYLHNQTPNFDICDQYYAFNEVSIVKSIFKNIETGEVVINKPNVDHVDKDQKPATSKSKIKSFLYQYGRSRNDFIYCVRNLIWNCGKWNTNALKEWIKEQNPTCIFFFVGDYFFLFNIVLEIAHSLNIPVYSYYVDDFYFSKKIKQKLGMDARLYRKAFKKLYSESKMNFCISEKMANDYENQFHTPTHVLMNTSNKVLSKKMNQSNKIIMSYFGNISYNRWENLSLLSDAISTLNKMYDKKIEFNIYSGEKNKETLEKLTSNPNVNFKGQISTDEVLNKMIESDILVHVESFNEMTKASVKYSVSTKIPDLLASNRIIIAFGPEDVASIEYLSKYNTALVLKDNDVQQIMEQLKPIYLGDDFQTYKDNAIYLYNKNHTSESIKEILYDTLK